MSNAPRRRLQALTLLLVLILGGMALPGIDAAVFHARGAATAHASRFEGPDSPGAHSIQCPLAQLLVSGRALAGTPPLSHSTQVTSVEFVVSAPRVLEYSQPYTPDLPRAPPLLIV